MWAVVIVAGLVGYWIGYQVGVATKATKDAKDKPDDAPPVV